MAEELPDGTRQGYFSYCEQCGKTIETNIQGNVISDHICVPIKVPEQIGFIIPIWGNAINKNLKDFTKWFNENYIVSKK